MGVLNPLIRHCLPGQDEETYRQILALRLRPTAQDLPVQLDADAKEDLLSKDDHKEIEDRRGSRLRLISVMVDQQGRKYTQEVRENTQRQASRRITSTTSRRQRRRRRPFTRSWLRPA